MQTTRPRLSYLTLLDHVKEKSLSLCELRSGTDVVFHKVRNELPQKLSAEYPKKRYGNQDLQFRHQIFYHQSNMQTAFPIYFRYPTNENASSPTTLAPDRPKQHIQPFSNKIDKDASQARCRSASLQWPTCSTTTKQLRRRRVPRSHSSRECFSCKKYRYLRGMSTLNVSFSVLPDLAQVVWSIQAIDPHD